MALYGGGEAVGRSILAIVAAAAFAATCAGQEPADSRAGVEFFETKVRPLLAEHCYRCHSAEKHENDLFLNSAAGIAKGGDRGPPIVPGKPDESVLIQA